MKKRNKKTISLLAYRRKKQKQIAKKDRRAVGDESGFPAEEEGPAKKSGAAVEKTAKIYYMSNYLKSKKLEPLNEEKNRPKSADSKEDEAKIIRLSSQRKKGEKKPPQKRSPLAKVFSLDDYRKKKERREESQPAVYPQAYGQKKAMALTAMALAAFFAFAIFFKQGESIDPRAEKAPFQQDNEGAERGLASPKKPVFIRGQRPDSPNYKGY